MTDDSDRRDVDAEARAELARFFSDEDTVGDAVSALRGRGLLADRDPWKDL